MGWTEWFKGFNGDEKVLRDDDKNKALNSIDKWIQSESGMPKDKLAKYNAFFCQIR